MTPETFHDLRAQAFEHKCGCGQCDAMRDGPLAFVEHEAQQLVRTAAGLGVVLSIEPRPLQPLAMGHYETFVAVRLARGTP
jgi:hypothetical protein